MNTCAILVLYQPDWRLLQEVLPAIKKQCRHLIVVDNSDKDQLEQFEAILGRNVNSYSYKPLFQNKGIAAAQNIGITMAYALDGMDYLIFFDQDSVPSSDMIQHLTEAHEQLTASGTHVGAVGPRSISRETGKKYEAKFDKGRLLAGQNYTAIRQLISSGSLVSLSAMKQIGCFLDEMFIDLVDFEWCWRANRAGYTHYIVEQAVLQHMFGASERRVLGFRITTPSAFRIYFQFRNYLWLVTKTYVPFYWKISAGLKLAIKFVLLPIVGAQRINYVKRIIRGIFDGLFRRKI